MSAVPESTPIDDRVVGEPGPVPKWDIYENRAYFICPHCWLVVGHAERRSWTPPEDVMRHCRSCKGIKPWQLGLDVRRKQKQIWLARNQQSLF